MSSVIEFLEKLGEDAALRGKATRDLPGALEFADLSALERAAILGGSEDLTTFLGLHGAACALIHAPEDDEEETEDEPQEDEDGDDEPGPERAVLVRDAAAA